jgi:hypothetical protein
MKAEHNHQLGRQRYMFSPTPNGNCQHTSVGAAPGEAEVTEKGIGNLTHAKNG